MSLITFSWEAEEDFQETGSQEFKTAITQERNW